MSEREWEVMNLAAALLRESVLTVDPRLPANSGGKPIAHVCLPLAIALKAALNKLVDEIKTKDGAK